MWQCDNCGYTDEDGRTFDEEIDEENPDEVVRYCPECGSDEVFLVDEDELDDDLFDEDEAEDEDEDDAELEEDDDWDDEADSK